MRREINRKMSVGEVLNKYIDEPSLSSLMDLLPTNFYEIKNAQCQNHVSCGGGWTRRRALVGSTIFESQDLQRRPLVWLVKLMGNGRFCVYNRKYPRRCAVACSQRQVVEARKRGKTPQQWIIERDDRLAIGEPLYIVELYLDQGTGKFWALNSGDYNIPVTLNPLPIGKQHRWEFIQYNEPQQQEPNVRTLAFEIAGRATGIFRMGLPRSFLENDGRIRETTMSTPEEDVMPEPSGSSA